jgi:hypothetical protein
MARKTPTASDIKAAVSGREDSHFFDRKTLKFFGDTMSNFGTYTEVGSTPGSTRIILYRKRAVKHGLTGRWVFDPVAKTLTKIQDSVCSINNHAPRIGHGLLSILNNI